MCCCFRQGMRRSWPELEPSAQALTTMPPTAPYTRHKSLRALCTAPQRFSQHQLSSSACLPRAGGLPCIHDLVAAQPLPHAAHHPVQLVVSGSRCRLLAARRSRSRAAGAAAAAARRGLVRGRGSRVLGGQAQCGECMCRRSGRRPPTQLGVRAMLPADAGSAPGCAAPRARRRCCRCRSTRRPRWLGARRAVAPAGRDVLGVEQPGWRPCRRSGSAAAPIGFAAC